MLQALSLLPENALVGLITFGTHVRALCLLIPRVTRPRRIPHLNMSCQLRPIEHQSRSLQDLVWD